MTKEKKLQEKVIESAKIILDVEKETSLQKFYKELKSALRSDDWTKFDKNTCRLKLSSKF